MAAPKRNRLARFVRVYLPIIVSIIVAFEIGIQAWIYNQQRHTMNAQRAVMDEQLKTMNGQLNTMQEQTNTFNKTLDEARKSANAAVNSANSGQRSAGAAERGVAVSAQSMKTSQRAYVGIATASLNKPIRSTEEQEVKVTIENKGQTPARNAKVRLYRDFLIKEPKVFKYPPISEEQTQSIILPGVTPVSVSIDVERFDARKKQLLLERKYQLYIWGTIQYDDVFNIRRKTLFCFVNNSPDVITFSTCTKHNSLE